VPRPPSAFPQETLSAPGMAEKFLGFAVPQEFGGPEVITRAVMREVGNVRRVMESTTIKLD
jgi:hypothetical protein